MTLRLARRYTIVAMALVATACTSIPLTSLPKIADLDPVTLDPADIEVAVRLEDGLALEDDDVTLDYAFINKLSGERLGGTYSLAPVEEPLTPFLQSQVRPNSELLRYRLTAEQAADIREARATAFAWPEETEGNRGISFAAGAQPCLTRDANPFRALRFSVYLRTDPQEEFFTLFRNKRVTINDNELELSRCSEELG